MTLHSQIAQRINVYSVFPMELNEMVQAKLRRAVNVAKHAPQLLRSIPSRVFFGTNTRFWAANVIPYTSFLFKKKTRNENAHICRLGYEKARPKLGAEFWKKVRATYDRCIEDNSKVETNSSKKKRWLVDAKNDVGLDDIIRILKDESVNSIINDYYGLAFYLLEVNAWRNYPADERDYVYSNFWHLDDFSYTSLRVFCFLSSGIEKDTGATRIASIADSKNALRKFGFLHTSIDGENTDTGEFPFIYLSGDLGDVFVFSADRCLHAATSILKDWPRDMLELVIDVKKKSRNSLNILVD